MVFAVTKRQTRSPEVPSMSPMLLPAIHEIGPVTASVAARLSLQHHVPQVGTRNRIYIGTRRFGGLVLDGDVRLGKFSWVKRKCAEQVDCMECWGRQAPGAFLCHNQQIIPCAARLSFGRALSVRHKKSAAYIKIGFLRSARLRRPLSLENKQ